MRSQFFDGFNFNDKKYSLVAIEKPEELFNIKNFLYGLRFLTNPACAATRLFIGWTMKNSLSFRSYLPITATMRPPLSSE